MPSSSPLKMSQAIRSPGQPIQSVYSTLSPHLPGIWSKPRLNRGSSGPNPVDTLFNTLRSGSFSASDPTGSFSVSPGGYFNLQSSKGWGISGSASQKSLGVNIGQPDKQVSIEGNFGADPGVRLGFQFGQPKIGPDVPVDYSGRAEASVESAIPSRQDTFTRPSAREYLDKKLAEYREKTPDWHRP
jgi:hypothetical protein